MENEKEKYLFLNSFIKKDEVIKELLSYTKNKFTTINDKVIQEEELYIETWGKYFLESKLEGVFNVLSKYLVQLQFPVKEGVSKTQEYKNCTLKGTKKLSETKLVLEEPDSLELEMYESIMVGKVPILIIPNSNDFNTIVCALTHKNEPKELPSSMGAVFINGINNWDRIHQLQEDFTKKNPYGNWIEEFKTKILPNPHFYKDKIIVLSSKPYSGVQETTLGLSKDFWKKASTTIRREHECAHLFTLKYYGSMANNMHDELVADYTGITSVLGRFDKRWFLNFMGLENFPDYREGGRLQNYKGKECLSEEAFKGLKIIVKNAVDTIAEFDNELGVVASAEDQLNRIKSICELDLITMALLNGKEMLMDKYHNMRIEEEV